MSLDFDLDDQTKVFISFEGLFNGNEEFDYNDYSNYMEQRDESYYLSIASNIVPLDLFEFASESDLSSDSYLLFEFFDLNNILPSSPYDTNTEDDSGLPRSYSSISLTSSEGLSSHPNEGLPWLRK